MDVIVWDMAHKVASWSDLEQLPADIALLNEARVPDPGPDANVLGGKSTEGSGWVRAILGHGGRIPP